MKDYIETQYKNLDFTIPDDYVSRREVYAMLDYIGGTDADEAYFQGWDAAIDEACSLLMMWILRWDGHRLKKNFLRKQGYCW